MNQKWWERPVCFICDYWYLILVFLGLILGGIWLLKHMDFSQQPVPPIVGTITEQPPTATPLIVTATPQVSQLTPTVIPALTETSEPFTSKPVYIFGMIPVNWTGTKAEFEIFANGNIDYFVQKSAMDQYFDIQIQILDESPTLNFNSEYILEDIVNFGVNEFPADRYIGITSGDITSEGDNSVLGFTYGDGAYSVLVEAAEIEIVAHELGHTYGLCDEYDYQAWVDQNQEFTGGCPNRLPPDCNINTEMCLGVNTDNGENSIMGAAGYEGGFGFNTESFDHLQKRFQELSESVSQ